MPPTSSTRSCPPRSTGCSSSTEAGHPSGMSGGSRGSSSINCSRRPGEVLSPRRTMCRCCDCGMWNDPAPGAVRPRPAVAGPKPETAGRRSPMSRRPGSPLLSDGKPRGPLRAHAERPREFSETQRGNPAPPAAGGSDPVRPDPVRPDPVRPDPVRPDPVRLGSARPAPSSEADPVAVGFEVHAVRVEEERSQARRPRADDVEGGRVAHVPGVLGARRPSRRARSRRSAGRASRRRRPSSRRCTRPRRRRPAPTCAMPYSRSCCSTVPSEFETMPSRTPVASSARRPSSRSGRDARPRALRPRARSRDARCASSRSSSGTSHAVRNASM